MDIIVTTPKSEIENCKKEAEALANHPDAYYFRMFKNKPNVNPGDKIFFVENGIITGYGVIFEISQSDTEEHCEITDRYWGKKGYWMIKYRDWTWLDKIIHYRGFQGYRYIEKLQCSGILAVATKGD